MLAFELLMISQHGSIHVCIIVSVFSPCTHPPPLSLSLCWQGVIQDVKLIFAPNGYITQCPNLNRSKCNDDRATRVFWTQLRYKGIKGGGAPSPLQCTIMKLDCNEWCVIRRWPHRQSLFLQPSSLWSNSDSSRPSAAVLLLRLFSCRPGGDRRSPLCHRLCHRSIRRVITPRRFIIDANTSHRPRTESKQRCEASLVFAVGHHERSPNEYSLGNDFFSVLLCLSPV